MKKFVVFLFFNCASCILPSAFSQNPLMKIWDKRFGGYGNDYLFSIQVTIDGGYILGGQSNSGIGGDKSEATWGSYDYWIVKTDLVGNKQWDKRFGGTDDDRLTSVRQTSDGGFILGGTSNSGVSGDKTELSQGSFDYWIVKTDSLGNKQWDKRYGGTEADFLWFAEQTSDGGYILGGSSYSDSSGDKIQDTRGSSDYWIIKTDSIGIKKWDKDFGGTDFDGLASIQQTSDGGYILGGSSVSGISGDKTQPLWGGKDFWIVKTDSVGIKQWDKDFGGSEDEYTCSISQTTDGGFILGVHTLSGISGDKTQPLCGGSGDIDCWIIKTDSLGIKQWDKDFGGSNIEELFSVSQTTDGGYLLAGDSYSIISCDKTENNIGFEQTWVVKTDSLANVVWDKTIFTYGHDEYGMAIQSEDGCYLMGNQTVTGIGGYKTQPSWGSQDFWIIKFCDTTFLQSLFTAPSYLCPGTCVDFTNLSYQATIYQWSFPGAIPNTSTAPNPTNICYPNSGSYDVQLIAFDSNDSDTLLISNYITVFPAPPPQSITQSGDTLFANAGIGTYQWYFNGNALYAATDYYYVATASGDYNVVVTDSNDCEVEAVINDVIAQSPLAVGYWPITVYPNPVTESLTVIGYPKYGTDVVEISIYNTLGEKIITNVPEARSQWPIEVDCQFLPAGLYYLEITSGEKIYRTKFLK